ncbi:mechanosensitive ion channel protein 10-like isoform X1 [Malania oleifera]|uniref:mechanosensitive ion channel protein 10-like isoform X1 n=1 Tax=Malania oleifera TaxID=397392 RepID=UPI0025ADCD43|nr:mechanosensitive ion channel protein 10-like isoform X1 [Malania oleifera]
MREEQNDALEKATPNQVVLFMDQRNELADQCSREEDTKVDTVSTGDGTLQSAVRKQTLRRLSFSKPKARLADENYSIPHKSLIKELNEELDPLVFGDNHSTDDDYNTDDEWDEGLEEDGETYWKKYQKRRKFYWRVIIEWVMFVLITSFLLCSLTVTSLKQQLKWGIEVWKWCLMVLVLFCGRLVSGWVVGFFVFIIERNFMLREKVLYFVYGLRKSFQNCIWLGLVLLAWTFMFNARMHKKNKLLRKVFQALVAFLIGATIWLVKIILVKVLASSFHVATYFDRMKESVFHHYILDTLSGPPMDEGAVLAEEEHRRRTFVESKSLPGRLKETRNAYKSKKYGSTRIDIEKLRQLSMESTTSAWSMKRLMSYVMSFGLSTISNTVDDFGKAESEISSEWEARNCAHRIFKNVAKPGAKYIEEEDLSKFLKRVEIHTIFPLFEGALKTGRISRSSFKNWVVRAYFERKSLAHSLNDTKTAVQQLHKLASAIVSVIIIVETLMVIGLASTKIIVFVTTQLVLLGFMFQNMCKTIFESIIFVFVMHPFDIGDRCVVDGVQMVVEEMNILTTVFLRYDMEKIYYPNSLLLTKPISNFYRSPDMGDGIDFTIDVSTSFETIVALKKAIQIYLESKPKHWNPKHSVIVKEIENVHKMKMCLCVQHTINHQNYGERNNRVSELLLELKKIFESLGIKYHLLPQQVHLTHVVNTD